MMWQSLIFMAVLSLQLVYSYKYQSRNCTKKLLQEHYIDDDFVFRVMIKPQTPGKNFLEQREFFFDGYHFYLMNVIESYKDKRGKLPENKEIYLYTPKPIEENRNTTVHFVSGKSYIVSGQSIHGNFFMDACNYNRETKSLSVVQRKLLQKRAYGFNINCQIKKQKGRNTMENCFYTDNRFKNLDKSFLCVPNKKDRCIWKKFHLHPKQSGTKV